MPRANKIENLTGLTAEEVLNLRKEFGFNLIPAKDGFFWVSILLSQFKSPLIYILFFAGLVSLIFGNPVDVVLILAVAVLNVLMGFYQEYSAQKTLKALQGFLKSTAAVIRASERKRIPQEELVPGDLVVLSAGDKVPADGVLFQGDDILANEAVLTGESEAVVKSVAKKNNNLFMGSSIVAGMGLMKVEKTGLRTEIGKISFTLSKLKEEKTPFQKKIEVFGRNLALIILSACLLIFLAGVFFAKLPWLDMLQIAIALSVAAIPEGLPIAMTVIMALGMRRILKKQGLVKKMVSLENLGGVSVILTDKTGTLTEGIMKVEDIDFRDKAKAFLALALANNQKDSLEIAIWEYLKLKSGQDPAKIINGWQRIFNDPFNSEKKYALTISRNQDDFTACLLGAPEIVLSFCDGQLNEKKQILAKIDEFAFQGLRMVGLAIKEFKTINGLKTKKGFLWLGFCAIEDPLRQTAKEAVSRAISAGIEVKMVTGDYRKTAESIARRLGLPAGPANVLEGKDLEKISDDELEKRVGQISVFCRVSPRQKLKIAQALKNIGESVAMVGDGINDALALKKADIGIVVGSATDVAKETSDLILLDASFKTIIESIEEGRLAFTNIKKVVTYVLSNSFVEIILIFGALLLKLPTPLIIAQILWLHLICDGPPDIALSFDKNDLDLMAKKPKDVAREQILPGAMKFLIGAVSLLVGGLALFIFQYLLAVKGDLTLARTAIFLSIGAVDLIYVFSFRNLEKSIFKTKGFFSNKWLLISSVYGFGLLIAGTYIPFLNKFLGTSPLSPVYWVLALAVGVLSIVLIESVKFASRRLAKQ